jgi:alcohol dehydrogenase
MFGFRVPTRVHVAPGCLSRLPEALSIVGLRRVLLVVDPGLVAGGWPERVQGVLEEANVEVELFDAVEVNPRTTTATKAAEALRGGELEGIVGLGGGSVLDAAKAAAMLATNAGQPEHFEGRDRFAATPLPFVAVPTTCGTGSEVTWVSVLTHEPTRTKISIKGESMFPRLALVDADLIATLPGRLVATTGLDAMTHALEATTCNLANPVSDALAEKAIGLLLAYLPRAAADPACDAVAREAVMRAATLAGLAFGNADVAGVHCLSESLGGLYDVPHGLANAVLLVPVLRAHGEAVAGRLAELEASVEAVAAGPAAERAERFLGRLEALARELEMPPFSRFGIPAADHARIAESAARNGSNSSNPRPMAATDYRRVLESLG